MSIRIFIPFIIIIIIIIFITLYLLKIWPFNKESQKDDVKTVSSNTPDPNDETTTDTDEATLSFPDFQLSPIRRELYMGDRWLITTTTGHSTISCQDICQQSGKQCIPWSKKVFPDSQAFAYFVNSKLDNILPEILPTITALPEYPEELHGESFHCMVDKYDPLTGWMERWETGLSPANIGESIRQHNARIQGKVEQSPYIDIHLRPPTEGMKEIGITHSGETTYTKCYRPQNDMDIVSCGLPVKPSSILTNQDTGATDFFDNDIFSICYCIGPEGHPTGLHDCIGDFTQEECDCNAQHSFAGRTGMKTKTYNILIPGNGRDCPYSDGQVIREPCDTDECPHGGYTPPKR